MMTLQAGQLAFPTGRAARGRLRDSTLGTARSRPRDERPEPLAEPGSAGREPTAVGGAR
jgi:hypothetical protein